MRAEDVGIVTHGAERLKAHIAALHRPLVVLLQQDRADQSGDGGFVREDADDVGTSLDLASEPFEWIGAVDLGTVLLGARRRCWTAPTGASRSTRSRQRRCAICAT